ncbi:hypothetical protein RHMOL_Rhmol02G0108200 [Rhododendron molle]|uniref:Uncharacterized protein n=2 Tax=Rhododendron molle TaxID=49168 RepID=A0ACC0PQ62_RHOML|nr:hypothetical protein RHMOL_Rhmol02G0108200 [Rhododendron molle]KAI8567275.1 hypothetical protein RHMOL_Rhmol02G0108200 [Rhododendron molle]
MEERGRVAAGGCRRRPGEVLAEGGDEVGKFCWTRVGVAPPKLHSSSIQHVLYYSLFVLYCVLVLADSVGIPCRLVKRQQYTGSDDAAMNFVKFDDGRTYLKWAFTLMSQHQLAAADRYGLERLRLLCEANLCDDVVINTVATTLALAEQHRCSHLKSVCLKLVTMPENLRVVMQMEGFEFLKESCSSVLTKLLQYIARISEHYLVAAMTIRLS